jgi:hypothetical protein
MSQGGSKHPEAGALIIGGVLTSIADLAKERGSGRFCRCA